MSKGSKVLCGLTQSLGGCAVPVSPHLSQTAAALLFMGAAQHCKLDGWMNFKLILGSL